MMVEGIGPQGMEELNVKTVAKRLVEGVICGAGMIVIPDEIAEVGGESLSVFLLEIETLAGKHEFMFSDTMAIDLFGYLSKHIHARYHAAVEGDDS